MFGSSLSTVVRGSVLSMLMLSACGGFGPQAPAGSEEPTSGPPIALRTLTLTPGCFSSEGQRESFALSGLSEVELQSLAAERQMREFRISYIRQEATLIRREVRRSPTATYWARRNLDEHGGLFIEGFSTARGEGWGRLHFIVSYTLDDPVDGSLPLEINADIRYSPQFTRYDFGGRALEVHDNYIAVELQDGVFLRGCDPRTRTSFEVLPPNSPAAAFVEPAICWAVDEQMPVFETEREAAEFEASRRLLCLRTIAHVTL